MTQNDKIRLHIAIQVIASTIAFCIANGFESVHDWQYAAATAAYFILSMIGHICIADEIKEPI
jgi:hypothetical protein